MGFHRLSVERKGSGSWAALVIVVITILMVTTIVGASYALLASRNPGERILDSEDSSQQPPVLNRAASPWGATFSGRLPGDSGPGLIEVRGPHFIRADLRELRREVESIAGGRE